MNYNLSTLPSDSIHYIFPYLEVSDLLAGVCPVNKDMQNQITCYINYPINYPLKRVKTWFQDHNPSTLEGAAIDGALEVLQYMIGRLLQRTALDDHTLHTLASIASFYGHVPLLKWILTVKVEKPAMREDGETKMSLHPNPCVPYRESVDCIYWTITPCICWMEKALRGDQPLVLEWFFQESTLQLPLEELWCKAVKFKAHKILALLYRWGEEQARFNVQNNLWITRHAIEGGDLSILKKIIAWGVGEGTDPSHLLLAARFSRNGILKWLKGVRGIPWEQSGVNVLREYASQGDCYMVNWCIKKGALPHTDVLLMAARKKHWDLVKRLVKKGVRCDSFVMGVVCAHGCLSMVKWLLQHTSCEISETTLEGACKNGHLDLVSWYYEQGYTFSTRHLYQATNERHRPTTEYILNRIPSINRLCYQLLCKQFPHLASQAAIKCHIQEK